MEAATATPPPTGMRSPVRQDTNFIERLTSPVRKNNPIHMPNTNIPRLVIEQLVLTNFKSYAGKQVIGPFHCSFSAVVGPNGSGKSNVIDSMLFVFGFRAAKMRQSKLKELIHNSEAFPDLEFCQVDIHFKKVIDHINYNDPEGSVSSVDVPDSQLIVSRRATNKNQSTYYINQKISNYTEVTTMLKNEGIDLDHKRFLILQGEVEMISQMKPKAETDNDDGLLEYLEDIIGTSSYKEPIENLNTKVDSMQDELAITEQSFQYVNKNMDEHDGQKNNALQFLEKEKNWKDETQKFHQLSIKVAQINLQNSERLLNDLNDQIGSDKQVIKDLELKLKDFSKNKEKLSNKRKEINSELELVKSDHKKAQQKKVQASEKLKVFKKKVDSVEKQLKIEQRSISNDKSELQTIMSDFQGFNNELEELNSKLEIENSKLTKIRLDLSSKTKKFSDQIEKLQSELDPWKKKINDNDRTCSMKQSAIEISTNDLKSITTEDKNSIEDLNSKENQLKINDAKIDQLKDELSKIEDKFSNNQNVYNQSEKLFKSAETEVIKLRERVSYAKSHISSAESHNKVLNGLQALKSTGRVNGFHGRLGDLGIIDDKYDIAVSTGGGSLSDFVVDSVEDAQICIDYLRKKNLGFGKFIVLQKLKRFDLSRKNTPMNIPRLFDLIKPVDSKFAPAFYSSMYDTLVAKDLNEANRASSGSGKRWRVVTLDGKLVDVSGTMSGGGNRASKGAMKLSSQKKSGDDEFSQASVQMLVDELYEKESAYNIKEDSYRRMQIALRELSERIPIKKTEITRLNFENDSLKAEVKELKFKISGSNNNKKKADLEFSIKQQISELEILQSEKGNLVNETAGLENEISSLNKKIIEVGGLELKKQTSIVNDLKESVNLKNQKKEKDEMQAARLNSNIEKLEKKIDQLNEDSDDCKKQVSQLENGLQEQDSQLISIEEIIKELEYSVDKLEIQINEIIEHMDSESSELEEKNSQISKFLKNIEKYSRQIEKNKDLIKQSEIHLSELEYRNILEYITWVEKGDPFLENYIQGPIEFENLNENIDLKDLGDQCEKLKDAILEMEVNLDVLPEYGRRLMEFTEKKNEVEASRENVLKAQNDLKELNDRRLNEFKVGFENISSTLKDMYFMITNGGVAELEFCDVHDPFQEGIAFSVMPPKKSWRNISNLSGGEKTLASLALVFALHQYKPTPLYVMDEIDAALDFKNVSIVANYIKSRTKNAQFIVISLRNNMFELSEKLVGIYKTNNMTRSATLVNKDLVH